jgi:hypothetical protein
MPDNVVKENLLGIRTRLEGFWEGRDRNIEEVRNLRWNLNQMEPLGTELEPEEVVTPIADQIIERVTNTLVTDDPQIIVPPINSGDTALANASKLERVTQTILKSIRTSKGEDPIARFIECLVADGHGCLRVQHSPHAWAGFPRRQPGQDLKEYNNEANDWKRGRPLPISISWVDPLTVYPRFDELGLAAIMEVGQREVADLEASARKWKNGDAEPNLDELSRLYKDSEGEVEFVQYWTRRQLTYMVNGQVVHREPNKFGRPPYIYQTGISPASKDPALMGISILYPIRKLLPQFEKLLSQQATSVRTWAWMTWALTMSAASPLGDNGQPRDVALRPGGVVTLYPGEVLSPLVHPGTGPGIDRMIAMLDSMIQRAGLADAALGASAGESGYAINQLISAARMKLKPISQHGETGIEELIRLVWDIIEYWIKTPVYVFREEGKSGTWLSLSPEDLKGYRQVDVKLNPVMPTDEYARTSMAINQVQAGIISLAKAREVCGYQQGDELEEQVLLEEAKRQPELHQWMVQEALRRLGADLVQRQAKATDMSVVPQMPQAAQGAITQFLQTGGGNPPASTPAAQGISPAGAAGATPGPTPLPPTQPGMGSVGPNVPPVAGNVQGGGLPGVPPELQESVQIAAQLLSQGMSPDQILQSMLQSGLDQQTAMLIIQLAMQLISSGNQTPAAPSAMPTTSPGGVFNGQGAVQQVPQGVPETANPVQASPGVVAAPLRPPRPRMRVSGQAQGTPSGPRKKGNEA